MFDFSNSGAATAVILDPSTGLVTNTASGDGFN
jgi:hypothetical protein